MTTDDAILLDDVAVRYRLPTERIPSLKEFAIRAVRGEIGMREFYALKDISLRVPRGSALGIVGHNGAGKSTLLKVISRVITPTRGRVRLRGRVAPLLELGAGFDYELTGRENILLNGTILGFSRQDLLARQDRIIDFAGLRKFIDAPLRTYSSGMVVRLGFSIATDVQPDILIVDEVLGVGDAEFQTRSLERLQTFIGAGSTVLLVSHNAAAIRQMCSQAIWLDQGQMKAAGETAAVVGQYLEQVRENEAERLAQNAALEVGSIPTDLPIRITDVQILNDNGQPTGVFETGQPLVLEMTYFARQPMASIAFGMAIHRHDGVHVTGPNTHYAGVPITNVQGWGKVRYRVPSLSLLNGLYHITAAVTNGQNEAMVYDYHDKRYSFRVSNPFENVQQELYGIITLNGAWAHLPGDNLSPPSEDTRRGE